MRAILTAVAVTLGVSSLNAAPQTIKGELVDVRCALQDADNRGADHVDCALSCAKRGATMGILADDGVYTIAGEYARDNNKRLLEFVARPVEATGEVTEKDGTKVITVTAIAKAP